MEIGFSSEQLLDIGLNLGGFVAAGLLCTLVFSLFSGRREKGVRKHELAGTVEEISGKCEVPPVPKEKRLEFVNLVPASGARPEKRSNNPALPDFRIRNRREILEQARALLAQKKDTEISGERLPVTEAELSLLRHALSTQSMARS